MMKSVRMFSFLLVLLFTAGFANADTVWPAENGEVVYQPQLTDPLTRIAGADNDYSLVVWGDNRDGERNIYGQLMDPNQQPVWQENGRPLVDLPEFQNPITVVHSDDGWIVAWLDQRIPDGVDWRPERILKLYIQKFNDNGEPQWHDEEQPPANGVFVVDGNFPGEDYAIQLVSDENGGAYVVYALIDEDLEIADPIAQHVLSDGSFGWIDYGVNLLGPEQPQPMLIEEIDAFLADDGDGLIATWISRPSPTETEVRAQRVHEDGSLWTYDEAPLISDEDAYCYRIDVCTDGAGGAFVAWTQDENVYVQRVAADGTLPWNNTGEMIVAVHAFKPILVPAAGNTAILYFLQENDLFPRAQRFGGETGLIRHWGDAGIVLSQSYYLEPRDACVDGNGGSVVYLYGGGQIGRLIHVEENGTIAADHLICEEPVQMTNLVIAPAGSDRVSVSDYRSDGHISIRFQSYDLQNHDLYYPVEGLDLTTGVGSYFKEQQVFVVDGTPCFTWLDTRISPYHESPVMQTLDRVSGEPLLDEYGVSLFPGLPSNTDPEPYVFEELHSVASSDNAVITTVHVIDLANWSPQYYLQKTTITGDPLWGDTGIQFEVESPYFSDNKFALTATDDGGVILFFNYVNSEFYRRLGMQRFTAEGEPLWSQGDLNFIPINAPDENNDNYLLGLEEFSDGSLLPYVSTSEDVFECYRAGRDGTLYWDQAVVISPDHGRRIETAPFGDNVAVAIRNSNGAQYHTIDAQVITPEGDLLWGDEPLQLIEADVIRDIAVASTVDDHLWLAYIIDYGAEELVHVQRVNSSGEVQLLPAEGPALSLAGWNSDLEETDIIVLPDNSLYVVWESRNLPDTELQYRRIKPDGTFPVQYIDGPKVLHSGSYYLSEPLTCSDTDGGAYVFWETGGEEIIHSRYRNLMAQRLNDGFMGIDEPGSTQTPDQWTLSAPYPNPFNATTSIHVSLPQRTHLKAQVFDILGREVMTLADQPFSAGRHTLTVDASALASGMYFLRVNQPGGAIRMQKLVLLK